MKNVTLKIFPALLLLWSTACNAQTRPNIIIIMADDMRWDVMTDQFMPFTAGPKIAGTGIKFQNAFSTSGLCCPSRFAFLTNKLASENGVHTNAHGAAVSRGAGQDQVTLATRLHDAGYYTSIVGKYLNGYFELGPPTELAWYIPPGWDEWAVFRDNVGNYYDFDLVTGPASVLHVGNIYSTDFLADWAADVIAHRPAGKPFFILVTPFGPHYSPDMVPPRYKSYYNNIALWRPPSFNEPDMTDKASVIQLQHQGLIDPVWLDAYRKDYLRATRAVDDLVRTVYRAIPTSEKLDTIVVVTSDQGVFWAEHRLIEKNMPYEEAHRVPLVISYPNRLATRTESGLITLCDLSATLLDWAGAVPMGDFGQSVAAHLTLALPLPRTSLPIEGWNSDNTPMYVGTRTATHKTFTWSATNEVEDYDLLADPYELDGAMP